MHGRKLFVDVVVVLPTALFNICLPRGRSVKLSGYLSKSLLNDVVLVQSYTCNGNAYVSDFTFIFHLRWCLVIYHQSIITIVLLKRSSCLSSCK